MKLLRAAAALIFVVIAISAARSQPAAVYVSCIAFTNITSCPNGAFSNTALNGVVSAGGYYATGDGGGGTFAIGLPSCAVNGGSIIHDNGTTNCFYRVNSTWGPKEFGAKGKAATGVLQDDTDALRRWFDASQPHMGDADTYGTSIPLACLANTTIQGPENLTNASTPLFGIAALPTFHGIAYPNNTASPPSAPPDYFGLQGVIGAHDYCRLSGVSITGNSFILATTGTTMGTYAVSVSTVTDVNMNQVQPGNQIVASDIPLGTVVTQVISSPCCTVYISQLPGSTSGEAITFYGPDAVDVLGAHVTIDGFAELQDGRYNLFCGISGDQVDGLAIKDSFVQFSLLDNISIADPCSNVRITGDIVSRAGTRGIAAGGDEAIVSNNVIEESQSVGLDLTNARKVSVNSNYIQGNGMGVLGGAGILIANALTISICGNHILGNGSDILPATQPSADIYFSGVSDNINLCGNVYQAQSLLNVTGDVGLRPLYVYDAASGTVLTNTHFFDSPELQAGGSVYGSPTAAMILPQLQSPHAPLGQINGLTLSNDGTTATKVDVLPGEASDSTNSVVVQLPTPGCTVDLAQVAAGPGGLDDTTTYIAQRTYFYFLIASASGGYPACMASASTTPSFLSAGANYSQNVTGSIDHNQMLLYNLNSVAGLAVNQVVTNTHLPTNTKITGIGTLTTAASASIASDGVTVTVPTTANIARYMAVSDVAAFTGCTNNPLNLINGNSNSVASVTNPITFVLAHAVTTASVNDCITVSSGLAVQLSNFPTTSIPSDTYTVFNGLYRLMGALYTDNSKNVAKFVQDGDSFYLATPAVDIKSGLCAVVIGAVPCVLSVPCGRNAACVTPNSIKVDAFGRIVGGPPGEILISSFDQTNPLIPSVFPGPPGYVANTASPGTSYPFRLTTNGMGQVRVQDSSTSLATVYEDTDGWVLHRSLY